MTMQSDSRLHLFWAPVGTPPDDLAEWISLGVATGGLEYGIDVDRATGQAREWAAKWIDGQVIERTISTGWVDPRWLRRTFGRTHPRVSLMHRAYRGRCAARRRRT